MKNKILSAVFLVGTLLFAMPGNSIATTLGLTTEVPTLEASFALIDYLEFGSDGDLSAFGAEVDFADGVSPVGFTELGFVITFPISDPTTGGIGGFDIVDEDGLFLEGDLIAVGFVEDVIELQFDNLMGAAAGSFGSSALVLLAFDDPLGANPFASLVDGEFYGASITVSNVADAAPMPVPAALPLFLSGLLAFGWFERRRGMK